MSTAKRTIVKLNPKLVLSDEMFLGMGDKQFEIFDTEHMLLSIRSIPNGAIVIHGLFRNEVQRLETQ